MAGTGNPDTGGGRGDLERGMGRRARRVVEREFDLRQCAGVFAGLLENAYA